jgi:hypothetical protein
MALGKEATFIECLLTHSAKEITKRPAGDPFCRVLVRRALDKEGAFAECHRIRSAKDLVKGQRGASLPSVSIMDTRQ